MSELPDRQVLEELCAELGAKLHPTEPCIDVPSDSAAALLERLRDDPDFAMRRLVDLTAIDHRGRAGPTSPRFEVRYRLVSPESNRGLHVRVRLEESSATLDSVVRLWPAAEWLEREIFDLFEIAFHGHPDLRRILLDQDFEGAPLRRDFPLQPGLELRREGGS
jgi:NADH-quinone oxidoreductase subunit C